jgi:hypothetical protein
VIIDPLFKGTALSNEGLDKAVGIGEAFTKLLQVLDEVCPKSREFSIARTKLEEASFYAKKSLTNYEGNRQPLPEGNSNVGFTIEFSYNDAPFTASSNDSLTTNGESLDNVVFQDRAAAEKEATLQEHQMGIRYKYWVVSTGITVAPSTGLKVVPRTAIYDAITKEDQYAQGWAKGKRSVDGTVPDHLVSRQTGQPFSSMEWVIFAEKYLNEAKTAYANFLPDMNVVNIRLLKAASLLVSALQCSASQQDLDKIAGVSSTGFPIQHGGLSAFKQYAKDNPEFAGDRA